MSTFEDLSKIDVTKFLEEKQGFNYLQWMAAWALLKGYDPEATYIIHEDADGNPYFNHPTAGAFVKVGVCVKGVTMTEVLPVLDFRNKPVIGEKLNVFEVNSAIKRCLVKAMAMHGLGSQVYVDGEGHSLDLGAKEAAPEPKKVTKGTSTKIQF